MITATGRTFEHRDTLLKLGGWFNRAHKRWEFEGLTAAQVNSLRGLVGVMVTETAPEPFANFAPPPPPDWQDGPRWVYGNDETYRHHFAEDDPAIFWGFDSLAAFIDHVASIEPQPSPRDKAWNGNPEFCGTNSFEEALEIARTGWLGALGLSDLFTLPPARAKRRVRAVAGGSVNVGRMLSGVPDHMIKRKHQPANRVITLFVETVAWVKIQHDVLLIRALAVAAMVDNLERAGYQCNIVAVYSCYRDDWAPMQLAIRIKEAGERLSLADISFAFGHPSFARRLVYACKSLPHCFTDLDEVRSYVSWAFNDDHRPARNEFYIPGIFKNVTSVTDILTIIQPDDLPVTLEGF